MRRIEVVEKDIEKKVIYSNKKINKDLTYRLTWLKGEFYYSFFWGRVYIIDPLSGRKGVSKKIFSEKELQELKRKVEQTISKEEEDENKIYELSSKILFDIIGYDINHAFSHIDSTIEKLSEEYRKIEKNSFSESEIEGFVRTFFNFMSDFYIWILLRSPTFEIKSKRNFWVDYNLGTTDKYKLKLMDRVLWRINIGLSKEETKLIEKASKSDKEEFFNSIYNKIGKEFYYSMDLVKDSKFHFNKLCLNLENIISNSYLNKLENKFLCLLSEGWKKIEREDWEVDEKEFYNRESYTSYFPYYLELLEDIKQITNEFSKEEFRKIVKILEEKIEGVNFLLEEFFKKQKDKRKERIRKIFLLDKLEKLFKVK